MAADTSFRWTWITRSAAPERLPEGLRPHHDVTGVEAQTDVGDLEQPPTSSGPDHGSVDADARHTHPSFPGRSHGRVDPSPSAAQPAASAAPSLVAVPTGRCREDEHPAAERRDRLRRGVDPRELALRDAGSCRTAGTNPAHEREAVRVEERSLRAAGQEPSGPKLRRPEPTERISQSTRSAAIWWPHPGTSQTPQVIGAPATRPAGDHATSSSRTGRCSSRDRSQATRQHRSSASSACRGSAAGPPPPPRTRASGAVGVCESLLEVAYASAGAGRPPP